MAKPRFRWQDPFLLDEQLSGEERMVRDARHRVDDEQRVTVRLRPFEFRWKTATVIHHLFQIDGLELIANPFKLFPITNKIGKGRGL